MNLTLPFPPSVNGYWRSIRGRQILSERGRAYKASALRVPMALTPGSVAVTMRLYPPDRRQRDLDNYFKAVGDVIKNRAIEDDSQIRRLVLEWCPADKSNPRVELEIAQLPLENKHLTDGKGA